MIILITGATHTGKTKLAQTLLEKHKYPYLSIDHLKMGLIRSNQTHLTPLSSDAELTDYLWPIVVEMIKTAIENNQNMIVEGCYIPFDWKKYFHADDLNIIKHYCLVLSKEYIINHYDDIIKYENVIEQRITSDEITIDYLIEENEYYLNNSKKYDNNIILIDDLYKINL